MSFGSRIPAVATNLTSLAIALGIAASANALSLADLVAPGASFSAGNGTSYSGFVVKIQGKGRSDDLRDYQVVPTAEGFLLTSHVSGKRKGSSINLRYAVTGPDLFRAAVAVDAGQVRRGQLAVSEKLFQIDRIDTLQAWTREGKTVDSATFDTLVALQVREKISIRGDGSLARSGASVNHSFEVIHPTPEPTTALMLAAGLAGLAAARGRRRCRQDSR